MIPRERSPSRLSSEQRMRHEPRRLLDHVPQDLGRFIVILFATAVAAHGNLLRQHRKGGVRIRLAEHDLMRVREIAFVMEAVILAEYNPEVVFGHRCPPATEPGMGAIGSMPRANS